MALRESGWAHRSIAHSQHVHSPREGCERTRRINHEEASIAQRARRSGADDRPCHRGSSGGKRRIDEHVNRYKLVHLDAELQYGDRKYRQRFERNLQFHAEHLVRVGVVGFYQELPQHGNGFKLQFSAALRVTEHRPQWFVTCPP
jgi:hypothetical protein